MEKKNNLFIFSSNFNKIMKKFIIKNIIFLFPFIVFITIPSYILIVSGEKFKNIDNIVKDNERYLIGYAYDEQNYWYLKYLESIKSKYDIFVLGTSKVLQFRSNMFTTTFYNAGYTIQIIEDFIAFLENIPESFTPTYLIIGLDHEMFNESWNLKYSISDNNKWKNSFHKYPKFITFIMTWKDIINRKFGFSFRTIDKNIKYIGLNANVNNKGFRNDGSMNYGIHVQKLLNNESSAHDYLFNDTFDRINKGISRFEYGNSIDKKTIFKIKELLKYCQKRGVKLIAFLPPYADSVYSKMIESGKYNYIKEIYICLKPLFEEFGFELYDFSSASLCTSNDNEMIDGFHGSDVTCQRMLIKMLENNSCLGEVTDISKLNYDLKNKCNNYIIYE